MKRIIRLTESDLTRIVKRVITESNRHYLTEAYEANHWIEYTTNEGSDTFNFIKIQFSVAAANKLGWSTLYYTGGKKDWDRKFVMIQYPKTIKDVKALQTYIEAGVGEDQRLLMTQPSGGNVYNAAAKAKLEPLKTTITLTDKYGKKYTRGPFASPDNWYQMVCEAAIAGASA